MLCYITKHSKIWLLIQTQWCFKIWCILLTILDSHSIIFSNCLKKGLVYAGNPHHISQDRLFPDLSPAGMISSVPRTLQLFIFRLEPRFKETKKRSNLTSSGIRVDLSLIYPVSSLKQFFFCQVKGSESQWFQFLGERVVFKRRRQGFWWESFCNKNLSKVLTDPHFYQTSSPDGNVKLLFFLKLNNLGKHPIQETGCCFRNVCKFTWSDF